MKYGKLKKKIPGVQGTPPDTLDGRGDPSLHPRAAQLKADRARSGSAKWSYPSLAAPPTFNYDVSPVMKERPEIWVSGAESRLSRDHIIIFTLMICTATLRISRAGDFRPWFF
jgi:hypothetical protein